MRFVIAGLMALWSSSAAATCGFDTCPPVDVRQDGAQGEVALEFPLQLRATDVADTSALATQTFVGAMARLGRTWTAHLSVPFTVLTLDEEPSRMGVGNALTMVEWLPELATGVYLGPGIQVELPTGRPDLGESHGVGLGYVTALVKADVPFLMMRMGYARTFESEPDDGHAHAHGHHGDKEAAETISIEPHAPQEWLLRAGVGGTFMDQRMVPMIFTDLQTALGEEGNGSTMAAMGVNLRFRVVENVDLDGSIQVPVSAERRFDWRSGVGLSIAL